MTGPSGSPDSGWEPADYERGDRDDYLRLLREAWGSRALTPAEFDWWFDGNPAGSLRSVARARGRVAGVAGHSLLPMVLGGEERLATFSVHATTEPAMRGRGVFVGLERKHEREAAERGAAVVLAFASAPTAPLFLGPLGWTEVARYRVWARPLLRGARPGRGEERPDAPADAAASWPNHVIRDERHLRWRYATSPRAYRVIRSEAGYAVLGRKEMRGRPVSYVADLVAAGAEARTLLRRCIREASGRALLVLPAPAERKVYLSLGFVPVPWSLHFMGKALVGALDVDPRAWRFTLGDTDFF